ncbi:MAG TPA: hypothetical protein VHJ38_07190 [Nitrososphaeraceae archaeon]|jgi:hypothetical protein|nr:hypothetical protein [Nitrososphaeraceae archaeon]
MKIISTVLLVFAAMSLIVIGPLTLGNVLALKDEDGRYGIVTIDNVKGKDLEVRAYIYDEKKDKRIQGSPNPIDETATQVKHTFKWDVDDLPQDVGPGTQWIACIEFKNGDGEPSCFTDSFNSNSQPDRITLDADFIRED